MFLNPPENPCSPVLASPAARGPAAIHGPAAGQATPASRRSHQTWHDFSFSAGMAYVDGNFNHFPIPATPNFEISIFRAGTLRTSTWARSRSKKAPAPGWDFPTLDVGFFWARTFNWIHSTDRARKHQVYLNRHTSVRQKTEGRGRGVQVEFVGRSLSFREPVGRGAAKLSKTSANWNYSRSVALLLAITLLHFGPGTHHSPIGQKFTGRSSRWFGQGWEQTSTTTTAGKTFGITGYAWKKRFSGATFILLDPRGIFFLFFFFLTQDQLTGIRQCSDQAPPPPPPTGW